LAVATVVVPAVGAVEVEKAGAVLVVAAVPTTVAPLPRRSK
jgi:hypothetical protein